MGRPDLHRVDALRAGARRPGSCTRLLGQAGHPPVRAPRPGTAGRRAAGPARPPGPGWPTACRGRRSAHLARVAPPQPTSTGISISAEVSDPCRPTSRCLVGEGGRHITAKSPRQATRTSPSRGSTAGSTAPNQPRAIASSRVSTSARSPAPPRQVASDVVDGAAAAVEVPEAGLAAQQHDPVAQLGRGRRRRAATAAASRPCRGRRPPPPGCRPAAPRAAARPPRRSSTSCCSHGIEATPYRWPVQSRSPS